MPLDLRDCRFTGPALPEPYVQAELENELRTRGLLSKTSGLEGDALRQSWEVYRRKLRELIQRGGSIRVHNHVVEPLLSRLGYDRMQPADDVQTRESLETGGTLLLNGTARLRTWSVDFDIDLDAPSKRGAAYRYSHVRIAQRVLLAAGERVGLITNGVELRLLISDPARPDSQVEITIDPDWKRSRDVPDSFRLLQALASPKGVAALPEIVEKARLAQTRVTKELRVQARQAVERFVQEILDNPANEAALADHADRQQLAKQLWREGLITVYRLLFILKLETTNDTARSFSFASSALWRNTYSPTLALARHVRAVLDSGATTGEFLERGLRALFRMFTRGLECTELNVKPLGGALFGEESTPILSPLHWGERAVAYLLDRLLWTARKRGGEARERVHYGPLDVEDLGRVYEALLELEPGITTEPMCRLRRQKLEVVVPVAQGEKYRQETEPEAPATRPADVAAGAPAGRAEGEAPAEPDEDTDTADDEPEEDDTPRRGKKTKVEWIEKIHAGRFYLRVGLGRKATGSYYTPHSFVRFLVQETLGPQVAERSPPDDPKPGEILKLKVCDPAMGSGHLLVEACRFLGDKLYEACRLCDERALELERKAEAAKAKDEKARLLEQAAELRRRITDLPDPDDELVRYLPSRAPEGVESGISQRKALALCRRLIAVHCLYGVDKNPLAVELAKLSLWIEAHAEGLPLTFVDHRLVVGDSLTGPFFEHLRTAPGSGEPLPAFFADRLDITFPQALGRALEHVRALEASVGLTLADIEDKQRCKRELDRALRPFRVIAAAWSGGVMLGPPGPRTVASETDVCDDESYRQLLDAVAKTGDLPAQLGSPRLRKMIARGLGLEDVPAERDALYALLDRGACVPALSYDLTFPEVFYPTGVPFDRRGFDAMLGNPPWDAVRPKAKEFFARFDFEVLDAPTKRERTAIEKRLKSDPATAAAHERYEEEFAVQHRIHDRLYSWQVVEVNGEKTGGDPDLAKLFLERKTQLIGKTGRIGLVLPSAFHANEGATGVRRLYLEQMALQCCYSFENRRKLFEIHSSFKFALVVASRQGPTTSFPCAFYLHDDEWLFGNRFERLPLIYTLDFVQRTGGEYLSLLELRSATDAQVAEVCFAVGEPFGVVADRQGTVFGRELHMTDDAWRFTPTEHVLPNCEDSRDPLITQHLLSVGYLVLHEGKTFWHYDDHWEAPPRYLVAVDKIVGKPEWLRPLRFFRGVHRKVSSATNERTAVFCVLPPGRLTGESCIPEPKPDARPTSVLLALVARCNSFIFDWIARQLVGSNFSGYIRDRLPLSPATNLAFWCHNCLRLSCNHAGYEPLWREQLGDAWREDKPPLTWPVLADDDARWAVRAAIDAVVADAYGLSREQYAHVLSTFSHASYPRAPELCLARFDELKAIGLDAFTKKYDPYWDIPLNENLPTPVIDLPLPPETEEGAESGGANPGRRRRRASNADPVLWEERSGQVTLEPPGPLFDSPEPGDRSALAAQDSDAPHSTSREHPGGPDTPALIGGRDSESAYQELLAFLRNQRTITSADAQNLLSATAAQVRPLLRQLVEEGHASTEGQRRGVRYLHVGEH